MEQEVTSGHPASPPGRAAAEGGPATAAEPVERVEPPCHDQPLHHRAADLGAMPEVDEGDVWLAGHNALNLGLTDAPDIRQRQPDAIGPPIGKVMGQLLLDGDSVTRTAA